MHNKFSGFIDRVFGDRDKANKYNKSSSKDNSKSFQDRLTEITGELNREDAVAFYSNDQVINSNSKNN